ncbi:CDPK-related kinase 1 [Phtheirospermum japonicum]|uniref:CDPK-related kinase 1 n=1 Tax=Phtheirospermum japonicum TaxID=374723 RepID=A0A830CMU2_9LAMI|nr:CDPK-related kinase 1 [Phtheirospermum japonicum]
MLRALTGHKNLVQFYDAYEDEDNVYVVMELCKGGELLDRILSRGGKYSEEDAKNCYGTDFKCGSVFSSPRCGS